MRLHAVRHGVEAQDRIGRPVDARNARVVEGDALIQGPAHGLQDAAFDLVADTVRIDDLAGIDRGDGAHHARAPRFALYFDFAREGAIGGEVLVAREREAAPAPLRQARRCLPAEALRREIDDVAGARILEVAKAELDG